MKKIILSLVLCLFMFSGMCCQTSHAFIASKAPNQKEEAIPKTQIQVNDRYVVVKGPIGFKMADNIINDLLYFDSQNYDPIFMFIDTPGGAVSAGYRIIDVMRVIKSPIVGVVTGICMSMGTHILVECDTKLAFEHSEFLIHDISISMMGVSISEAARYVMAIIEENNKALVHLADRLNITAKELKPLSTLEWFFNTKTAWDISMIDGIVSKMTIRNSIPINSVSFDHTSNWKKQIIKEAAERGHKIILIN